jgi:putative colanic acid biosynthesis acetyltransferase WcaF
MIKVRLDLFSVGNYHPGASWVVRLLWHFVGQRVLRSQLVTSYSLKAGLLRLFGGKVGKGAVIKPGVRVKYPWRLEIGDHVWIGEDAWIDNLENVTISNHACLSQSAYLCTGNHDWGTPTFDYRLGAISIAEGAWIGARSLVGPGVQVSEYAILTAGSVATRSLSASRVYCGNPAVYVKDRWSAEEMNRQIHSETHENTALPRHN